jgi:hypothetical protein
MRFTDYRNLREYSILKTLSRIRPNILSGMWLWCDTWHTIPTNWLLVYMSKYSNSSEGHKSLPSLNVVVHNCGFMIDELQGQLTTM